MANETWYIFEALCDAFRSTLRNESNAKIVDKSICYAHLIYKDTHNTHTHIHIAPFLAPRPKKKHSKFLSNTTNKSRIVHKFMLYTIKVFIIIR